ncbi:LysR family transcriptional regulator [Pseudaquabacterium rugosum]|uniref:LysR family transcriptional regulator n=1 Tax=Pseudaquabacterium rugosum TaxID=2984194 RepID=A0ABU9BGZ5_9BURK
MTGPLYNLARFDFVSIRLAVDCARTGSLTAAAQASNLVLPAASRRLKELERALDTPLFERHSRGLTPTAAGRVFLARGLSLLRELDLLVEELADAQEGVVRHVHLCASSAAITQFLSPLLAAYAALHPEVQVDLEEQMSEQVVAALREGRAEVAVFVAGPDLRGLDVRGFRRDELVLVVPKGHRLAGRTPIAFADTLDEPWISLNAGAAVLQAQQQAALAAGRRFRLRTQVRSFDAMAHMVASGLGIAAMPKGTARPLLASMGLQCRPLADDWARREIQVAIRTDADATATALRDFLVSTSRNAKSGDASFK